MGFSTQFFFRGYVGERLEPRDEDRLSGDVIWFRDLGVHVVEQDVLAILG